MLTRLINITASLLFISGNIASLHATSYFVSPSGNDTNTGIDKVHPFQTIQKAAGLTNPGDTVFIMNGAYTNIKTNWIASLTRSGTEKAWIVFIAYPGHKPQLFCNGWGGFYGPAVSYIEINGLEIIGNRDSITLDYVNSHSGSPECSGVGISFTGRDQTNHPHHIRIINNTISKFCQAGIGTIQCDYVTIDNNIVYGNAWYGKWAGSGISTYQNWCFDSTSDYKMFITRNVCYDNRSLVKWYKTGQLSDGNGIIIDDSKNTQNGSLLGKYKGRTLVANNVSFNNGGTGIHTYSSEHVDIVNNTVYRNAQVVDYASCYANSSNDVKIINNVIYADSGKKVNNTSKSDTNVNYDYNIYYGGLKPAVMGEHDTIIDPQFVNPSIDPSKADFRLMLGSYAICNGKMFSTIDTDIAGNKISERCCNDIGAYKVVGDTVTINSILPHKIRVLMN